jgi:Asp-tRNA(Asn)/Glu-tRNA(Gln) amidotransferase A subunit family amidase
MNDIYSLSAWQIAKKFSKRELTAMQISESFVKRIDELNPHLKAWVSLDHDYVFRQASQLDENSRYSSLSAVPVGVKDIFNTEVFPTQMGSPIWQGHKAGNDARCVSYLRDKGAIIFGKTDTAEFAVHYPGKVVNPWNINRVTGTSSGGSAVAVATGMSPVSLATQTSGSTIRPASWCGVYGMKPSFGLIPRTGVLKTTDTLDNIGYYGRDYIDLKILLDSMRVHGANYPIMQKKLSQYKSPKKKWKICFIKGHLWDKAPKYTQKSIQQFAHDISTVGDIEVIEKTLPEITQRAQDLHQRIYDPCLGYYFREELTHSPEKISEMLLKQVDNGKSFSPSDYKIALQEQLELSEVIEHFFQENNIDLLLHYSSNGSAPKIEPSVNFDLNHLWTLSWLPVINVPQFFCPQGLPYGVQFIGARYSDYLMFDFLQLLENEEIIPKQAKLATTP